MSTNNALTRALAITGTILVWFPILAPILLSMLMWIARGRFLFDYLMPAELFLFALVGSGLLIWAALRSHSHLRMVSWGFGVAVLMLLGGQAFAVLSGLASGEREAAGWPVGILIITLILYWLGIILIGTGGVLILKDLFKKNAPAV